MPPHSEQRLHGGDNCETEKEYDCKNDAVFLPLLHSEVTRVNRYEREHSPSLHNSPHITLKSGCFLRSLTCLVLSREFCLAAKNLLRTPGGRSLQKRCLDMITGSHHTDSRVICPDIFPFTG